MNAKTLFSALILICLPLGSKAASVTFTLSLDTATDPGATYTGHHAAGAGLQSTFVVGFNVTPSNIGGTPVSSGPIAAFCIELASSISAQTYTFDASPLNEAASAKAGQATTASSAIPAGGIGPLRAARVAWLFDNYYQSSDLSSWTQTTAEPRIHAFQLALWEISHDTDLSMTSTSGDVYIGSQGDTLRDNAIALAQIWLNAAAGANITPAYESQNFDLWALTSVTGNTDGQGFQDVIFALEKGSEPHDELTPLLPPPQIPEPSTPLFILSALGAFLLRRRR